MTPITNEKAQPMAKKKYDSTVARIAGNLLSGGLTAGDFRAMSAGNDDYRYEVQGAVAIARAIVAEVERTEPTLAPETTR